MVKNAFSEEGKPIYLTKDWNGLNLPIQWFLEVPGVGGNRKATELLPNTNIIRGVNMHSSEHPACGRQISSPDPEGISISGLLADRCPYLYRNISMGDCFVTQAFRAPSKNPGLVLSLSRETDIFENLVRAFAIPDVGWKSDALLSSVVKELGGTSRLKSLSEAKINEMRLDYFAAKNKYESLAHQALNERVYQNINSYPVPSGFKESQSKSGKLEAGNFFYDSYMADKVYAGNDFREILVKTDLSFWPQEFALAELALKHNLTNNIILAPNGMGEVLNNLVSKNYYPIGSFKVDYNEKTNRTECKLKPGSKFEPESRFSITMDTHQYPRAMMTLLNGMMYMGFISMLVELVSKMKSMPVGNSKSVFDESLIQFTSEFDRVPQADFPGSGHNQFNHVSTLLSGRISDFHVSGNIRVGEEKGNERGTFGSGGENEGLGLLSYDHVSNSISEFFQIPKLTSRNPALHRWDNERFEPILPMGKNV